MEFTGERFVPSSEHNSQLELEHLQRYYSIIDLVKNKVVVDAASGEGYGASILARHANKVYGIDISQEAVTEAKQKYIQDNLHFINTSVESIPLEDNSVDVVSSYETIEHLDEFTQQKFLTEIKRIMKKSGILIMSTPDKELYSDIPNYNNEFHVKEFYKQEFYDFLSKYFLNVKFYYQRFEVASFIENKAESIKVIPFEKEGDHSGKYLIALCSDIQFYADLEIGSVVKDVNNQYEKQISRILQLQDEVEERNKHIKNLDEFIESRNQIIRQQNSRIEELSLWGLSQGEELKQMSQMQTILANKEEEIIRMNDTIQGLNELVQDLTQKVEALSNQVMTLEQLAAGHEEESVEKDVQVENLNAHIGSLLEQERILNNIYESDGWVWLKRYYKLRDVLIPRNTKRMLLMKILFKLVRDPKLFVKHLNPENIRKFFKYLKSEESSLLGDRVDHYLDRFDNDLKPELKIFENQIFEPLVFEEAKDPKVSIIIPVFNQWHYTYSCLNAILENTKEIAYEVIIADDASSDETKEITARVKNIVHIRNEDNQGFLLNCNHAAQYAKGQYILFLNNDTNVQSDWLKPLVELLESNDGIGMVGSKLVYADGRLQEAGGIIWKDASGWNYGHLDDPDKPEYNYVKEVDYISGASIMIRARLWREIGGFDERYIPAYFEDSDLAFEVRKHGYKVVYQPKSVVVHFEGISHGTNTGSGIKSYQIVNKEKFVEKWHEVLEKEHFDNGYNVFNARDRSSAKDVILVVDHYVPHYDKDAGSRTTFQYLKLFTSMNLNAKFVGDNFYRHEPYSSDLEQMGIEVLYGSWYKDNLEKWLKQNGSQFKYVYLNRPHISIKYVDLIRKHTTARILYYGHDLHYLREQREYELTFDKDVLNSSKKWKKLELDLITHCDVSYYPSSIEVEELRRELPTANIRMLSPYIYESESFNLTSEYNAEKRQNLLFVGGFAHKPNIDGVIWFMNEVFPKVSSSLKDMKVFIVGSNPPELIRNLGGQNVIVTGYVTDEELMEYYAKCRIVVVPLRYGAGIKGKVVEAMYYGLPVITTPTGAEGLTKGESVMVVRDTSDEMAQAIEDLYTRTDKLNQLSRASRTYVQDNFSREHALQTLDLELN
jgi:O-antigen biosynthesis protein